MELGLSTFTFPWNVGVADFTPQTPLTLPELIIYTAKNGIKYLQVGDNLPLHDLPQAIITESKKLCQDLKVNIQVGTRGLTKENIEMYLEIAQYFFSPFLRVVIDDEDFYPDVDEVVKTINSLLPELKKKNICLAIENHDRFTAKKLEEIIKHTSEEFVGICLDTSNSIGAGEGIMEILPVLRPYAVNVHIKDFDIRRVTHKMGFKVFGAIAGKGMLDIPWLIGQFNETKRCQTATLEIWMDNEPTMDNTLKKENEWVEKSIKYLKNYLS